MRLKYKLYLVITTVIFVVSCGSKTEVTSAIENRTELPRLRSKELTTLISDSGITKYRIHTKEWNVYDRAEEPYWDFPQGVNFERFDTLMEVDANISSKRARYYDRKKLWELNDSVRAENMKGEKFASEQMFWDESKQKIYTDSLITITQTDKIIIGNGFESDQTLSKYTIKNVKGIIPIKENDDD